MSSRAPRPSLIALPPDGSRVLSAANEGALVYVVAGVLALAHPVPALARALAGELIRMPRDAQLVLRNGSKRDQADVVVVEGLAVPEEAPLYSRYFSDDDIGGHLCVAASPRSRSAPVAIQSNMEILITRLGERDTIVFEPTGRSTVFVISGEAEVGREPLGAGERLELAPSQRVRLASKRDAHLLVIDCLEEKENGQDNQ